MSGKPILPGKLGEKEAVKYLRKNGYTIIKENFRTSGVEVDIIARIGDILCFIEVKMRKNSAYGLPEEFVDFRKQQKILKAAKIFCTKARYGNYRIRFDIISVIYSGNRFHIHHIEDAFEQ